MFECGCVPAKKIKKKPSDADSAVQPGSVAISDSGSVAGGGIDRPASIIVCPSGRRRRQPVDNEDDIIAPFRGRAHTNFAEKRREHDQRRLLRPPHKPCGSRATSHRHHRPAPRPKGPGRGVCRHHDRRLPPYTRRDMVAGRRHGVRHGCLCRSGSSHLMLGPKVGERAGGRPPP